MLDPNSSDFARYVQTCCVDAGFLPKEFQLVVDAQSIPSLIAAGFGVALVPQSIARFTTTDIVFRPIRPSPPTADVFLVFRQDETSMVVHNFIKLALRYLNQRRGWAGRKLRRTMCEALKTRASVGVVSHRHGHHA